MFRGTGFRLSDTLSPAPSSQSSVGEYTPSSSQQSTQSPPPGATPVGRSASLSHLHLDRMALSSPDSKSRHVSTPKSQEVEFPLRKDSEHAGQSYQESDLQVMKGILTEHAERILKSALIRAGGNVSDAINEVVTRFPPRKDVSTSPAPLAENGPKMIKAEDSSTSSVRHVNGVIPRQTLRLRNGPPAVAIKFEERTQSPDSTPSKSTISPSSYYPTTKSSSPFNEETEADDEDINMDESDSDEVDFKNESDDSVEGKAQELLTLFPNTDLEDCKRILQCADNDLVAAVELMEEERGGDLFTDTTMNEASERVITTAPSPSKLSPSPGPSTTSFTSSGTGKKRVAEYSDDRPIKKTKSLEGNKKSETGLQAAGQWVIDYFAEDGDICLVFEDGEHPCRFSKRLLSRHFRQLELFFGSEMKLDSRYNIENHSRETFDLLLQWAVTRNIQFDPAKHQTRALRITSMLEMVKMANDMDMKELQALEGSIARILTEILKEERTALKGEHIQFAYANFDTGHLIQDVFVRAAVRNRIEFRKSDISEQGIGRQDIRAHMLPDGARKNAWGANTFPFAGETEQIKDFEIRLLRASMKTWESREIGSKKLGSNGRKTVQGVYMTDPLTGERFFF